MSYAKSCAGALLALCFAVFCVAVGASSHTARQTDDAAAVRALFEKFLGAYQKGELDGAFSLWSEKSPVYAGTKKELQQSFIGKESIETKIISLGAPEVAGDTARLQVVLDFKGIDSKTRQPSPESGRQHRTVEFAKEGGQWRIWRYASNEEEFAAELIKARTEEARSSLLSSRSELVSTELTRHLHLQARPLAVQGKYDQAIEIFRLALTISKKIESKGGIAVSLNNIGTVFHSRGNYDEALRHYLEGLRVSEELGSETNHAALLMTNIGHVYRYQGKHEEAFSYYQRSLAISEKLNLKDVMVSSLNNIGLLKLYQGDSEEALDYYERALRLAQAAGAKEAAGLAFNNIGNLHMTRGNLVGGLSHFMKALAIRTEIGNKPQMAGALNNIGLVHLHQENYRQAEEYFQKGLKLAEETGAQSTAARLMGNLGTVQKEEGNYAKALEYFERTLALAEKLGDKEVVAGVLSYIGEVYALQGDHARALEYSQRGLSQSEESGFLKYAAIALNDIARANLMLGRQRAAVEYADRAARLSLRVENLDTLWSAHMTAGKAHLALDQLDMAKQSFLDSISAIERTRSSVAGGEQDRRRFFETRVSPYYLMADLLLRQKDEFAALTYGERAKGRVLLDVLGDGKVDVTKAMTGDELNTERSLRSELVSLNTQISRLNLSPNPVDARLSELNARLAKARLEYEAFRTNLYGAHPELKVRRGETRPFTPEAAADLLPDSSTALLEYVVGAEKSYLFVITRAAAPARERGRPAVTLNVYPLNVEGKTLAAMIEDFRGRVARREITIKTPARQLYELLVGPAERQLAGVKKLCIVPDGPLWNLPFQALYTGEKRYLLEQYAIFFAPSLTVLREMSRKRETLLSGSKPAGAVAPREGATSAHRRPTLLALGNPELAGGADAAVKSIYQTESLVPLPEAEREAKTIAELYGQSRSRLLIGGQARESLVKAEAGKFRVLHFAAHSILDDRNPMYSRIILSQDTGEAQEDGMLEAWEIMRLDLTADLAIFSACQTGQGGVSAGEGVIGMSWALFVAGCPSAVVSQWKVDSARTADLMIEFHRGLVSQKEGGPTKVTKAEALRGAALKLLRGPFKHPAYWAGFVLVGVDV